MTENSDRSPSGTKATLGRTADRPYWVMIASIIIRALHQVGAAVFLAVYLLADVSVIPGLYTALAFFTGAVLMFTEGMRHRQWFREVSGISTIVKLVVLGLAWHGWLPAVPSVLFAFLLASFCSHAPKHIRHRLLL